MRSTTGRTGWLCALACAGLLAAGPAVAGKPAWAGGDHGGGHGPDHARGHERQNDRGQDRDQGGRHGAGVRVDIRFGDREHTAVRDYYAGRFRHGHCPPGLAKKHNGCLPPGQAKKWHIGRRLPREVIFYDLPPKLVVRLGRPPAGYRYVRVANDILMIAAGTGMVIDAIQDLGRM